VGETRQVIGMLQMRGQEGQEEKERETLSYSTHLPPTSHPTSSRPAITHACSPTFYCTGEPKAHSSQLPHGPFSSQHSFSSALSTISSHLCPLAAIRPCVFTQLSVSGPASAHRATSYGIAGHSGLSSGSSLGKLALLTTSPSDSLSPGHC
jgi:hypothetical protein